jgi:hypothetical protein
MAPFIFVIAVETRYQKHHAAALILLVGTAPFAEVFYFGERFQMAQGFKRAGQYQSIDIFF